MKTYVHTLILTAVSILGSLLGHAQNRIYPHRLFDMPPFAPDTYYAQPIGIYVSKKPHYSVLVKVRLPGDTIYYTIPGVLPTGDSFSFRIKPGKSRRSDTLYVIRRGGVLPVQLYEVCMYVISHKERPVLSSSNADFTNTILMSFYDSLTSQNGGQDVFLRLSRDRRRGRLADVPVFSSFRLGQVQPKQGRGGQK